VKVKFLKRVLVVAMLSVGTSLMAAEPKPTVPEQTWTVNFKDVDIVEVARFVQEVTGKPMIVDPKVRAPVRVIANKPLNKKELYELFLAVLDVHGFTAFESDGVVRIIINRDARNLPIPTEETIKSRDDGYVTQIIQLNNISAAKVLGALRPLVPQYSHFSAYEPSNALIISDTRANIARINDLILQMDKAAVLSTDVVQLRYAQASEVVTMITQLEKPDPNRGVTTSPPIVVADKRINAVIVSGDEMSRQRIRGVVESLDRPQTRNANARVVYLKYAKAADVAKVLTGMAQGQNQGTKPGEGGSGQTNVQADEATNSVLITADGDSMQSLMAVVDSLDIRRAQVLVEAIIVEIQNNAGKEMGVQWMYADAKNGFGSSTDGSGELATLGSGALKLNSSNTQTVRDTGLAELAAGLSKVNGQSFGVGRLGERTNFMGLLKLLQEDSGTNILSTPNLLTTDNTKAKISVGQKVPFKQASYPQATMGTATSGLGGGAFNTFQREDVGITLEVTPHINEGDSVVLDIDQEVSSISNINSADGIITNQRKIKTQILTADGQTVVLGGLIKDDVQTGATRVPLLGSIPVLGHLFRTQSNKKVKTNLLVFIRATVIRDDQTLQGATAEKYRTIRDDQLNSRRTESDLISAKSIPVLPEWKNKPLPAPDKKTNAQEPVKTEPSAELRPAEPAQAPAPAPATGE